MNSTTARLPASACASRQDRLERAEDRERPVAQRAALGVRHREQVADDLDRDRGRERVDQVDRRAAGGLAVHRVEQRVDAGDQRRLHRGDVTRRQRAGDQPSHARVQRRVVEHEARRVVLVERRVAVLRPELLVLVGAEARRVLVDRDEVGVARQEHGAVGEALDRVVLAQRAIRRIRVVVERRVEALQVERGRDRRGVRRRVRRCGVRSERRPMRHRGDGNGSNP